MLRSLPVALLLLAGCRGTFLAQAEAGYAIAPAPGGPDHGVGLTTHLGGGTEPGVGVGYSQRIRQFSGGGAYAEFGPHAFFLVDDDGHWGAYGRASLLAGYGRYQRQLIVPFTMQLSPGLLYYPDETSPLAVTFSLSSELSGDVVTGYGRWWNTLSIGVAIGGVQERR